MKNNKNIKPNENGIKLFKDVIFKYYKFYYILYK